jgi:hypothetical protein
VPAALLDDVARLCRVCNVSRVFVSTREPQVVRQLKLNRALFGPGTVAVWDDQTLRYGNGFHTIDLLRGLLNATDEAAAAIRDILVLADSDFFFGSFDSNFSRLVAQLGAALGRFAQTPARSGATGWIINP